MRMKHTLVLAAALVVAAIVAPIGAALHYAGRQAQLDEQAYLESLASEVLRRAVLTRQQIVAAVEGLQSLGAAPPCSAPAMLRMRQLSMASLYLQAVGVVRDGALVCSSLGMHEPPIALGPGQGRTATGLRAWVGVELPIIPGQKFNVYADAQGNAAIVHPDQIIDIVVRGPDVVLAVVVNDPGFVARARGTVQPEWVRGLGAPGRHQADSGSHTVVIQSSSREHNISGLAAAPRAHLEGRMRNLAWVLLPIGTAAGLLLAAAVVLVTRQRLSLKSELRTALQRGEFFMRYQPMRDLRDPGGGRWAGAEALLRWRRGDGTLVPPDVFIPVAEQAGLIQDITRHVMALVARDTAGLLRRHPEFHVSINFSALDLRPGGPIEHLGPMLARMQAPPGALVVEITERGFVDAAVARPLIRRMREMGVRVAIDDFGTGYSSLSALESLEVELLKIDKSFVDTIGKQAATSQVVHHIIEMGKALKLDMIAEGVETQEQADYLRAHGVQYAQGWLFGKPMPVEELAALLAAAPPAP